MRPNALRAMRAKGKGLRPRPWTTDVQAKAARLPTANPCALHFAYR